MTMTIDIMVHYPISGEWIHLRQNPKNPQEIQTLPLELNARWKRHRLFDTATEAQAFLLSILHKRGEAWRNKSGS